MSNPEDLSAFERFRQQEKEKARTTHLANTQAATAHMGIHPDDVAVERFAATMKAKMAVGRTKGRKDWETCSSAELWQMLREHVEKGDPVDVANFAMMIHHQAARGL